MKSNNIISDWKLIISNFTMFNRVMLFIMLRTINVGTFNEFACSNLILIS